MTSSRRHRRRRGVTAYVTGAAPLIADQFEVGSKGNGESHRAYRPGDRGDAVLRLPFDRHNAAGASRLCSLELAAAVESLPSWGFRHHRAVYVRHKSDDAVGHRRGHRLRDLLSGSLPRNPACCVGSKAAHRMRVRGTTCCARVWTDGCRCGRVLCTSSGCPTCAGSLQESPAAVGIVIALVAADLVPAMVTRGRHFGLLDRSDDENSSWRRIGTAIVRWPGPVLVVTCAVAVLGLLALSGYTTSYDARPYMLSSSPANVGCGGRTAFSDISIESGLLLGGVRPRHA